MKLTFPQMLLIEFKSTEIKMTDRAGHTRPLVKERGREENIWRRNILGQREKEEENIWRT